SRITKLQSINQPSDVNLTLQAIQDGYINLVGGFILDIPKWIEETLQADLQMRQESYPRESVHKRIALWQDAMKLAETERLAQEIQAEIACRLGETLTDISDKDKAQAQERSLTLFNISLQTYTEEIYARQWARIQFEMGNVFLASL